ncbi:MAG: ATP-binding protein [Desulforhopalus sp.]
MKLSTFIRNNIEAVLQEWEEFADSIQPSPGNMDKEALRNDAKQMLEDIADELDKQEDRQEGKHEQAEKSKGQSLESASSAAQDHGLERMHFGFEITDIISEYRFMRTTVIRLWHELRPDEELDNHELIQYNEALDQLIYEAVNSFSAERDRQKRLFDMILSSDHGYILDLDGRFVYANQPMLQNLNISLDELIGKSYSDLHFSSATEIQSNIKHVVQKAEQRRSEVEYYFPSGEVRYMEYVFTPIIDNEKKVEFVAATERDITERKRATEELRKSEENLLALNKELEQRVEKRTRELLEIRAKYLNVEKLSAIGKISAAFAHEFNNPLQGVMNILHGFKKRRKLEEEEDREDLDLAISESYRMKNLIRGIQHFNLPSADNRTLMDVHASIDYALSLCSNDFEQKGISTVLNYAEKVPQIPANPDQIKQVIVNLLNNAADACVPNGGEITISTWQEEQTIAIAIQDTGVGINPENLGLIFEPFYTTKPVIKGTGLGLSVCHGIVQAHHGEIQVKSQPGEGSTFTILLPVNGD